MLSSGSGSRAGKLVNPQRRSDGLASLEVKDTSSLPKNHLFESQIREAHLAPPRL